VTPPSVFDGAAATWDASVGNVALFGGRTFPGKAISNELWRLGVAWEKAPPATAGTPWPPALYSGLLAHDASRGRLVLVGNGAPAPTWEWDHTTLAWSDRSTAGGPKNNLGAFAWDERRHVGVFFGAEAWGETWEWDGVSGVWTRKQFPSEKAPAPRFLAAAAYDSDAGRVLLFGGGLADSPGVHGWTGDLWEWDGTSWTLLEADGPAGPDEREAHGIAYDSDRHCLVVFGGSTFNSEPRDLWEWHR
jgi:hypothetical protein